MRIARMPLDEARHRATELLTRVGLGERVTHRPSMLSGGEQQRVAVARALVMRPALLLADEPTGDLDERTADALHGLLREMHAEHGLTSVIATHNPRLAAAARSGAAAGAGAAAPGPNPVEKLGQSSGFLLPRSCSVIRFWFRGTENREV